MDHSEARKKVCVVCYNKASSLLSFPLVKVVQEFVFKNYSLENPHLPSGICNSCRRTLSEYKNGNTKRTLPVITDYNPGTRVLTCGQSVCPCCICEVAKSHGHAARSLKKRKGRPPLNGSIPKKGAKICPDCLPFCIRDANTAKQDVPAKSKN